MQVIDKLPTGEPVVIGLILRRCVISHYPCFPFGCFSVGLIWFCFVFNKLLLT